MRRMRSPFRVSAVIQIQIAIACATLSAGACGGPAHARQRTPSVGDGAVRAALDRITPDSLRGHLSFIASDSLEGRGSPSRGQDLAAEYLAAQFRRAGLEPAGDLEEGHERSYFQVADGTFRNVIGLLRGSDPALGETYLILSAHYDHLGIGAPVDGDAIYNGANDDGSGTVSVVEIASALATLSKRPKRSLLFIAWSGEEQGLLGSTYYGEHPVVPLEKTVAMINLEQIGRTDSSEGPQLDAVALTGFDFSEIGAILEAAGEQTGVRVYKHPENSDEFFDQSDNQTLAAAGVPAHTLCVAFRYPDYHQPGDHWEKIDYRNLAKIDRMVALGLWTIANEARAPAWNETNPKAAPYVEASKALRRR